MISNYGSKRSFTPIGMTLKLGLKLIIARHGLGNFEFLVAMIIWYDILHVVNLVSQKLQAKDMFIHVAIEQIKGFFFF